MNIEAVTFTHWFDEHSFFTFEYEAPTMDQSERIILNSNSVSVDMLKIMWDIVTAFKTANNIRD